MQSFNTILNAIRVRLDSVANKVKVLRADHDAIATVPIYERPVGDTVFEYVLTSTGTVENITTPIGVVAGKEYYVYIGDLVFNLTAISTTYIDGETRATCVIVPGFISLWDFNGGGMLMFTELGAGASFKGKTLKICNVGDPVKTGEMPIRDYIDSQIKAATSDVVRNNDFNVYLTSSAGVKHSIKVNKNGELDIDAVEED